MVLSRLIIQNTFDEILQRLAVSISLVLSYFESRLQDPLKNLLSLSLLLVFLCSFQGTMVETRGVEPLTSCLQGRRSPN